MPLLLSVDLRWRVVMFYLYRDYNVNEIADLLIISAKSVSPILSKFYETGDVQCKEEIHGPERKLDALEEAILIEYLMKTPMHT